MKTTNINLVQTEPIKQFTVNHIPSALQVFEMGVSFTWGVFVAIGQLLVLIKIYEFIISK